MANVAVVVTEENVKIQRDGTLEGAELEAAVDEDITRFDEYFQRELGNDPLVKSERAVLKTYLWYKCRKGVDCALAQDGSPSGSST